MADTKSMTGSFWGDDSDFDSKSMGGMSTKSKAEAKRARHMLKLKKRMENLPQRKLLFRPKVYESWREGEMEDDERERLLRDIAEKEARLLARKHQKVDDELHSDSDDENQVIKALDRLKSRRQREEEYKTKLDLEQKRREEEEAFALEEKLLSELQNPSVYGWFYTDGYYDNAPYFGVREDLVPKYLEEQERWHEKWMQKYPETFTMKFKRFFWPPKLRCKGKTFRTRGSYLDFPEVIADWPKLTTEVNFERDQREYITNRHELFGVTEEQKAEDEAQLKAAIAEEELTRREEEAEAAAKMSLDKNALLKLGKKPTTIDFDMSAAKDIDSHAWYYDDDEGEFLPKKLGFEGEYYFDNFCWRHKKKRGKYKTDNQQTPYDWYFDDTTREFKAREEFKGIDEVVYDHKTGVFRIHLINTPVKKEKKTKSGRIVLDFPDFKDEATTDEDGGVGGPRKKYTPKHYYFDEEFGKWILRSELPEGVSSTDITWDDNGKRYTRKFEGPWRGLTGYCPDDFYYSNRGSRFLPKPARQADNFQYIAKDGVWRKKDEIQGVSTFDTDNLGRFYFDDFEGQFKQKDLKEGSNARYKQGKYSKIWRKVPQPQSGLYPSDFYWDTHKKRWLPRAVRLEMLKNAEVDRKKKIMQGQAGVTQLWDIKQNEGATPEDFFFDYEEGIFLRKSPNVDYIYDDTDKCWKLQSMRDKPRPSRFHHEFYFSTQDKVFYIKNPDDRYDYDQQFHVWKRPNAELKKEDINEWYYDLSQDSWVNKSKGGSGATYDPNLGILVKPHSDSNYRTPDDFYFSSKDGRFFPKDADIARAGYYIYDPTEGAWKVKDAQGAAPNNLNARSFFWDDAAKTFRLKVGGRERDYFYDTRARVFRHILASGKTKTGYKPSDFVWNTEFHSFIPLAVLRKGKTEITDELPKWDPLRTYDKPWMSAAPLRNPDAAKTEERRASLDAAKSGKSGWFGKSKK